MRVAQFLAAVLLLAYSGPVRAQSATAFKPQHPRYAPGSPEARTLARLPVSPLAHARRGAAVFTVRATSVFSRNLGAGRHVLRVCRRGERLTFLGLLKGPPNVLVRLTDGQVGMVAAGDVAPAK